MVCDWVLSLVQRQQEVAASEALKAAAMAARADRRRAYMKTYMRGRRAERRRDQGR
jgi:hypothetical protein